MALVLPAEELLRRRDTQKWNAYPPDIIPLWIAETDFATCPEVLSALRDAVGRECFGYPLPCPSLGEALHDFYAQRYGWAPDPECVIPVSDVVRGIYVALHHLTDTRAPLIIPTPTYMPFLELPDLLGREVIFVDAHDANAPSPGPDLQQIDDAFRAGARTLLLCSPYNPLGLVFDRDYLCAIADCANAYGARVITDEIHAPITYEKPFIPFASVSETAAHVAITVTATSKAWNTAGLKCAQIYFTRSSDKERFMALSPLISGGFSTLGLVAAEAAWRAPTTFLDEEIAYLAANRDHALQRFRTEFPDLILGRPEATFLLWMDFSNTALSAERLSPGTSDADTPAAFLLEHAHVALNCGETFGSGGHNCARLNFGCARTVLDNAIDRIVHAAQTPLR